MDLLQIVGFANKWFKRQKGSKTRHSDTPKVGIPHLHEEGFAKVKELVFLIVPRRIRVIWMKIIRGFPI